MTLESDTENVKALKEPNVCAGFDAPFQADALLSTKATKFSTISFGALFNLVFGGLCLTTLQVVLAFYGSRQSRGNTALYGIVVGVSIMKLVVSSVVSVSALRILALLKSG